MMMMLFIDVVWQCLSVGKVSRSNRRFNNVLRRFNITFRFIDFYFFPPKTVTDRSKDVFCWSPNKADFSCAVKIAANGSSFFGCHFLHFLSILLMSTLLAKGLLWAKTKKQKKIYFNDVKVLKMKKWHFGKKLLCGRLFYCTEKVNYKQNCVLSYLFVPWAPLNGIMDNGINRLKESNLSRFTIHKLLSHT
jgi:hypothetical protein